MKSNIGLLVFLLCSCASLPGGAASIKVGTRVIEIRRTLGMPDGFFRKDSDRLVLQYVDSYTECLIETDGKVSTAPAECRADVAAKAEHDRNVAEVFNQIGSDLRNRPTFSSIMLEQEKARTPSSKNPFGYQTQMTQNKCDHYSIPPIAKPGCRAVCINGEWAEVCK